LPDLLDHLLARRSAPIAKLAGPAPSDDEIMTMLTAASRVPDHGMLTPFRFILYRGQAREDAGRRLLALLEKRDGALEEPRRTQELTRFSRAPLVVGVVSVPKESVKIPVWEMRLTGGAVAMNLVHAAHALGYKANWITNWYSGDAEARELLGLAPHEEVVGFVHIGRHDEEVPDRPRPDVATIVSDYSGPWSA
jgi:nitroreductase